MSNLFSVTLTILNGETESEEFVSGISGLNKPMTLNIFAPATLSGTVKVYVASYSGGTFIAQQSNAADIVIAADKATPLSPLVAGAMKLVSDSSEGDDRVFQIIGWPME